MHEELTQKIRALEEKIRLLEIENSDWTGRAEDIFLFASTAESISLLSNEKDVFEVALEQISIMKNIPYCAFGTIGNGKMNIEYEYASFTEEEKIAKIELSPLLKEKALQKEIIIIKYDETNSQIKIEFNKTSFTPKNILIISFANLRNHDGVLICIDNCEDDRLDSIRNVLKHSVTLINNKLDNLYLMKQLADQNELLEERIAESLGELEEEIKEHIRTEEALKTSEELYRNVFNYAPLGIFHFNTEGIITNCNNEFVRILGSTREKLIGLNMLKQLTDKNIINAVEKTLFDGSAYYEEYYTSITGGKTTPIIIHFKAIYEDGVRIIGGVALVEDVTEWKKSEEILKASEERFSRLSDLTYEGILIHKNGIVIDINSALERISGYSAEELIGQNIIQMLIPEKYHEQLFINLQSEISLPYEIEGVRKDGVIVPLEIESKNINYGNNNLGVRVTAIRDISIRKNNEFEIKKLYNAIEQSPIIVVITNKKGELEYVNSKFVETTGYTIEEILGKNPRILSSGKQTKEFYKVLWDTILAGKEWAGEFRNKKKNGDLYWVSARISSIKDVEGKITHFLGIIEDITEKKKMIDELVISKNRAENADKMKSIFLAQMSHEIRTPINALVSMASLLRYDFETQANEDQIMSFNIIDRAGGRIIRTIDLLLNLSEIQAGTYEKNDIKFDLYSEVLSLVVADNRKLAENKNLKLILNTSTSNTELIADAYTVNQIFIQLIDNAIKYTNEGEVDVEVLRNEQDKLVVSIKDTGIGIEDKYLSSLFEPFSQEDMGYTRKYEGNGIGMALVQKYCELNNAKIEIESKKGIGSIFRVIFN
ncbi:MAG: PAS domain-containing sensor histidine kinase [Bacteroidetes bacterium]|nr:PAS domain-containing sensor histidine kinase [Bacteroidota bacterium]MBU1116971.1 PAS domain-containing sensor histidine kinase [Bacteroidota bacterium]MBU1799038.1 PAS domain-containing sensor histidine kinase [Bacteroidota bacterium]